VDKEVSDTSKMKQAARTVFSLLPKFGLIPPSSGLRPAGISAMMTVKNEEDWIEKSVRSVQQVVNEIVVVDNGSDDKTPSILTRLEHELGGKLRLYTFDREDFCAAVNYNLDLTRFRWILRWHGDFIAHTTGPRAISNLTKNAISLDARRYYCIWIGPVSVDGDIFHQIPQADVELEPFLFTFSRKIAYKQIGRFEVLQVPWYYKRLEWRQLYFFHMRNVKSAKRLLYRRFWTEWMSLPDKTQFPTLHEYVAHRIKDVYKTTDLTEAMRARIRELARELVPYDKARFGPYPDLLDDEVRSPKYRLMYKEGRVETRNDIEKAEQLPGRATEDA